MSLSSLFIQSVFVSQRYGSPIITNKIPNYLKLHDWLRSFGFANRVRAKAWSNKLLTALLKIYNITSCITHMLFFNLKHWLPIFSSVTRWTVGVWAMEPFHQFCHIPIFLRPNGESVLSFHSGDSSYPRPFNHFPSCLSWDDFYGPEILRGDFMLLNIILVLSLEDIPVTSTIHDSPVVLCLWHQLAK